jgi:hypothetical protein
MVISASRLALAALLLFAGCIAEPRGYTPADLQARCITTGDLWHPSDTRDGFCEYPSPRMI